jgi:hypothetical protein
MCDSVNLHIEALGPLAGGKWVACRLSDGGSDGIAYDTRAQAVRHQMHWSLCCYVRIPPFGVRLTAREAESYLSLHRSMYDAGFRLQDPEDPYPIKPLIQVAAPRRSKFAYKWNGEFR